MMWRGYDMVVRMGHDGGEEAVMRHVISGLKLSKIHDVTELTVMVRAERRSSMR
jgi:hypothetical protein